MRLRIKRAPACQTALRVPRHLVYRHSFRFWLTLWALATSRASALPLSCSTAKPCKLLKTLCNFTDLQPRSRCRRPDPLSGLSRLEPEFSPAGASRAEPLAMYFDRGSWLTHRRGRGVQHQKLRPCAKRHRGAWSRDRVADAHRFALGAIGAMDLEECDRAGLERRGHLNEAPSIADVDNGCREPSHERAAHRAPGPPSHH